MIKRTIPKYYNIKRKIGKILNEKEELCPRCNCFGLHKTNSMKIPNNTIKWIHTYRETSFKTAIKTWHCEKCGVIFERND